MDMGDLAIPARPETVAIGTCSGMGSRDPVSPAFAVQLDDHVHALSASVLPLLDARLVEEKRMTPSPLTILVGGRISAVPYQGGWTWVILQYLLGLKQLRSEHVREWDHETLFHLLSPYSSMITFTHFPPPYFHYWMLAWLRKNA